MTRSADSLARDHTEAAINVLAEALNDVDTKYQIAAAKELLDRGHGKPLNATISVPVNRQQAQRLAAMTDEELQDAIRATPLPQLTAPVMAKEDYDAAVIETDPLLAGLDPDFDPLLD
jgi:hypothetical protein